MKVVILAAGRGERMGNVTEDIPKVLIDINGKPFLYYVMKSLQQAGYNDFGIIVGYKKEKILEFLDKYGFSAELIHQGEQLGTGHAVQQAEAFVNGENFICANGDDLRSIEDLKVLNRDDDFSYVMGRKVDDPEKYGVLIRTGDQLERIVEKPKDHVGNFVNAGIYKLTPAVFGELRAIEKSERGEYELTDAISLLAGQGKVKVIEQTGFWVSIGNQEDIPHVEAVVKDLGL